MTHEKTEGKKMLEEEEACSTDREGRRVSICSWASEDQDANGEKAALFYIPFKISDYNALTPLK